MVSGLGMKAWMSSEASTRDKSLGWLEEETIGTGGVDVRLAHGFDQIPATEHGHVDVHQDQINVGVVYADTVKRTARIHIRHDSCGGHMLAKDFLVDEGINRVVIDHQNALGSAGQIRVHVVR